MKMNFLNLIKFRKIFFPFVLLFIFYFIRYFSQFYDLRKLKKNIEQSKIIQRSEIINIYTTRIKEQIIIKKQFPISKYLKNCGSDHSCNKDEFVIHLNTGFKNLIYPKLCIDGKYINDKVFDRGINLVIIDNVTKTVSSIQNFNTNLKDSTNFEVQLLSLRPGDKIILFTFDEVPSKLSKVAKLIINELGSLHIQNLKFRTAWYLISEKQINGYSPFEEIHLIDHFMQWPPSHDLHACIPFKIKGYFIKMDKGLFGNKARIEYCKQLKNKWQGFCDYDVVNEPLNMYTQSSINEEGNILQNTPILIFTDREKNDLLSITLETLFRQPTVFSPKNVLIFYYDELNNGLKNLADLFYFQSFKIELNLKNFYPAIKSKLKQEFKDAKQFILIFGNLILTADFLNYFNQLIPMFWYPNSTLSFVSAWNDCFNGQMCTDEKLILRVNGNRFIFKHALAIKCDHEFFTLLERIIYLNSFENQSIIINTLNDGLIPNFPRILTDNEISDLFLNKTNEEKISLFENVNLNQIDALRTVESYSKILSEFKDNSLKINDEQSLIYYLNNRENNTRVNITIMSNSTSFKKICTIFNLKSCSPTIYINGLGDTLRFNHDTHLSVLIIKQSSS